MVQTKPHKYTGPARMYAVGIFLRPLHQPAHRPRARPPPVCTRTCYKKSGIVAAVRVLPMRQSVKRQCAPWALSCCQKHRQGNMEKGLHKSHELPQHRSLLHLKKWLSKLLKWLNYCMCLIDYRQCT